MTEHEKQLSTLVRYTVTKSPAFAAIALWVPYKIQNDPTFVACTDGRSIRAGEKFWDYENLEQAFILVHEIMHVALRHIPRGKSITRGSAAHAYLWNVAADAVINRALGQMAWLQTPKDGVKIENLIDAETLQARPPQSWSAEAVYAHLLEKIGLPKDGESLEDWLKSWMEKHGVSGFDLRPGEDFGEGAGDLESELAARVWASRLARAQAGDRAGGLLRELAGDFPRPKTPWQQILRALMQDAVMPQSRANWSRPSRRVLTQNSDWFEPATMPERGIRRAGIVVDTSGSIDEATLALFAAEIENVQNRTGCDVVLISADAQVQSVQTIQNDGRSFVQKFRDGAAQFKGGGGTAFGPAIERLNKEKVAIALYLTDMQGSFGDTRPQMPLIWCSTMPGQSAPFGRVIYLDPLDSL